MNVGVAVGPGGDHEGGGLALSFLAQFSFAKGDAARARALYRDALDALGYKGFVAPSPELEAATMAWLGI